MSPDTEPSVQFGAMPSRTAFDRVLAAVEAHGSLVRANGDGKAQAQCPAHDDRNPSLSIGPRRDGKGAVVNCFAGCQTTDILAALGLTMSDLFDDDAMRAAWAPSRDYEYGDGRRVHRRANKTFRQSGNTGDRSLFHADRIGDTQTVYVPEGEKDVEVIEAVGATAVCSAMGAGKADKFDWSVLAGRDVVVVADCDKPGRKHAADIAARLDGIATSVRIVEAKEGKDTADHIAAGYGLDDLVDVVPDDGLPKVWRANDLAKSSQPRWLAQNRLPYSAVALLIGDEGIGKSLLWVLIIRYVTTGEAWPAFGIPARPPQVVAIVVTEDDWETTVLPRLEVAGVNLDMVRVICADQDGSGSPIFPRDMHLIYEMVGDGDQLALLVVDAWLDTVPAGLSVRDPQQARQALHPFKELANRTDCAVLLLCHTNRVATANARDRYGATGELRKKARMTLFAQADDDGHLIVGPEKMNTAKPIPASKFTTTAVQYFEPTEDHDGTVPLLSYLGESDQTAREHLANAYAADREIGDDGGDVLAWLAAELAPGPRWAADIQMAAEWAGHSAAKLKRAKRTLHVASTREGPNGPWFWKLPQHQGIPGDAQKSSRDPWTSGASGLLAGDASTSQDVQRMNGETRRPLGPVGNIYGELCECGKWPARLDSGYCEWCTANKRRRAQ